MIIGYGITTTLSVLFFILYRILVKKREFWLSLLFACIAVVNVGYLMLSLAKSVEFAIFANDVAYLGSVFLSMCMFLTIVKLCGFTVKKHTLIILLSIATVMFLIIATSGILPWYYKSVSIESINGATKLVKEYGVLHPTYLVYLVAYFVAMISAIVHSLIKKKGEAQKIAGFLAFIVFINIAVWFIEKFTKFKFEFLSVSYLVSEILFIFLYWTIQDYVLIKDMPIVAQKKEMKLGVDILTMPMDVKIAKVLFFLKKGETLTLREREVLEQILLYKKRREIAEILYVSESSVKLYTRTLYSKLGVGSREELYALLVQENEQ